ncbi:MAG TPA: ribonuclease H family protein [Saprospiraceae bacterium]|nr:ribonuclease H family protein [Saprospiraceae bacterium]
MSKKKQQKYYVVWHGHNPGLYDSWEKCQSQVKNFPNAVYKSYSSRQEAEEAFRHGPTRTHKPIVPKPLKVPSSELKFHKHSISVDAACSGNPGVMEYRGVWTEDRAEIFHLGPVAEGTNNIGEFLAIVHALALLQKKGDAKTPVYSDSKTAISWVLRKKVNTKLQPNRRNHTLFDLIHRAEKWLRENDWLNPLLKWDTGQWGENPADFGRK